MVFMTRWVTEVFLRKFIKGAVLTPPTVLVSLLLLNNFMEEFDYYKVAGILIKDRKLLFSREVGKEHLIAAGGVIERGEEPKEALIRELKEELSLEVDLSDLEFFGSFIATASGSLNKTIKMEVYVVNKWKNEPTPSNGEEQIEEITWFN